MNGLLLVVVVVFSADAVADKIRTHTFFEFSFRFYNNTKTRESTVLVFLLFVSSLRRFVDCGPYFSASAFSPSLQKLDTKTALAPISNSLSVGVFGCSFILLLLSQRFLPF